MCVNQRTNKNYEACFLMYDYLQQGRSKGRAGNGWLPIFENLMSGFFFLSWVAQVVLCKLGKCY